MTLVVLDGWHSLNPPHLSDMVPMPVRNQPPWLHSQGCFIGQETLSKLSHQDGVKQQLWGLDLDGPVQTGGCDPSSVTS